MKTNLKALMATIGVLLSFFGLIYLMVSFPNISFPTLVLLSISILGYTLFKNFKSLFDNE
jgi:hypothetical protein